MSIEVKIKKDFGSFKLDIGFKSSSRRIGILGASGCGKSLTLKCLAGIENPDAGRIAVNEKVLFDTEEKICLKPQVRKVGYLFQNYALFPTMTVEENIAAGLSGKKEDKRKKIRPFIEKFQLQGLEKRLPSQLSGGQQQRVALARILVYEPEVILLDEPFSALDIYLRDQMQRELMGILREYKGIVILVSHSRDEVYRMSEELLVLDAGKITGQGDTRRVFENPESKIIARLTGCKNIADVRQQMSGVLYVKEWDLCLPVAKREIKNVKAVGIRAHEFDIQETEENRNLCFPVLEPTVTEDLFEYNISFRTSFKAEKRIDWKISKYLWSYEEDSIPEKIFLKEDDLLFL